MCAAWEAMMVRNSSSLDRSSDLARLIRIVNRQTPGMSSQIAQSAIPATSASTWAVTPFSDVPQNRTCHEKGRAARVYVIIRDETL